MRVVWIILCVLLAWMVPAEVGAQIQLALPLDGYYRPGQYMPVLVIAGEQTSLVEIGDAHPTVVTTAANSRVIVPVLMLGPPQAQLPWRSGGTEQQALALQPLRDEQRLIGTTGSGGFSGREIFPDSDVVTVRLDRADPLRGWGGAWDALDAAVVDAPPRETNLLRAAGVRLMVQGSDAPAMAGDVAFMPVSARFDERAYLPTQNWPATQAPAVGQLVVLVAVVLALLVMATMLWRSPWQMALAALLTLLTMVGIEMYRRGVPLTSERELRVTIEHPVGMTLDRWRWHKALVTTRGKIEIRGFTYPIFAGASHLRAVRPRLLCDGQGRPIAIEWRLEEGATLATRERIVEVSTVKTEAESEMSPLMLEMTRLLYAAPGVEVVAEPGGVVVRRREQRPVAQ
jgi:hypothetical protein